MSREEAAKLARHMVEQYGGTESFIVSMGDQASMDLITAEFHLLGCTVVKDGDLIATVHLAKK